MNVVALEALPEASFAHGSKSDCLAVVLVV